MILSPFSKFYYLFFKTKSSEKDLQAARDLIEYMKNIYANPHEFYEADITQYENIDREFYETVTKEFNELHFNKIIDIEDLTVTQNNPNMRTCIRYFSNKQGTVNVSCFHVNFGNVAKFFSLFRKNPTDIKSIELETEFTDGSFILTNNLLESSKLIDYPDTIEVFKYTASTPISALLEAHIQKIEATKKEMREVHSIGDIIDVSDRMLAIKNRYMKSKGYADREMYKQINNGKLSRKDEQFIKVLEEVKEEQNL